MCVSLAFRKPLPSPPLKGRGEKSLLLGGDLEEAYIPEKPYLTWMGMAALMYVLHVVFGMKHELMLCEPNEKDGAFLLDDIMQAGNFGHHDARNKKFDMGSYWQNFFGIMGRNIAYFRFAPWNWLMSPMWRVYHFVWRKVNRYE